LALSDFRRALEIDPAFIMTDFANAFITEILFSRGDHINA